MKKKERDRQQQSRVRFFSKVGSGSGFFSKVGSGSGFFLEGLMRIWVFSKVGFGYANIFITLDPVSDPDLVFSQRSNPNLVFLGGRNRTCNYYVGSGFFLFLLRLAGMLLIGLMSFEARARYY